MRSPRGREYRQKERSKAEPAGEGRTLKMGEHGSHTERQGHGSAARRDGWNEKH